MQGFHKCCHFEYLSRSFRRQTEVAVHETRNAGRALTDLDANVDAGTHRSFATEGSSSARTGGVRCTRKSRPRRSASTRDAARCRECDLRPCQASHRVSATSDRWRGGIEKIGSASGPGSTVVYTGPCLSLRVLSPALPEAQIEAFKERGGGYRGLVCSCLRGRG